MPNGDEHGRGKEFEGRTYLYIRTHALDNGTEPLPAGLEHWLSPDIVVVQPGGVRGGEALAGQLNQVEVTVTNGGGIDANDAWVEAYFANPSTGFTPATSTLIGADFLSIPGYTQRPITFDWIPPVSEAGHRCLAARVNLVIPPDGYVDGTVFDVRGDRHVAQRNIHVLAMGTSQAMSFGFMITNPRKSRQVLAVAIRQVTDTQRLAQVARSLGSSLLQFSRRSAGPFSLALQRAHRGEPGEPLMPARAERIELPKRMGSSHNVRITMEPGAEREASVIVTRSAGEQIGELHVLEIVQTNAKEQVVGGLTLVVQN